MVPCWEFVACVTPGFLPYVLPMARETRSAVDGALALAAAMGIGRFAYTALLPATQRALGAGDATAGAIASVNLAGYLAGVLAARHLAASPARTPAR